MAFSIVILKRKMKYIFLFMLSMSALICSAQQDVTGERVIAKNALFLKNR